MKPSKSPTYIFGKREENVLLALWKWKVLSNAALTSKRFFPTASPKRAYRRLLDLKRAGLIEMRSDGSIYNYGWVLTPKGFEGLLGKLPDLKERGFRSEHFMHDLITTAFHIGDWLTDCPPNVTSFSEQELRRCTFAEYPDWVPQTELHRPDGYLGFRNGERIVTVAIESELNRKLDSHYEDLGFTYANLQKIYRVLWLVPSLSFAKKIAASIQRATSKRAEIHNFIVEKDFIEHGWQSRA